MSDWLPDRLVNGLTAQDILYGIRVGKWTLNGVRDAVQGVCGYEVSREELREELLRNA